MTRNLIACLIAVASLTLTAASQTKTAAALPVIVFTTPKGVIEMEMWAADAPKSVEKIVGLARKGFYRGQRFHRVTGSLAQIGDPQSRNMTLQNIWGTLGSQDPVLVSEISKAHSHVRGAVGFAHAGDPKYADSQIYIMKTASPSLDSKHVVIGHVIKGMDVVDKLEVTDLVTNVTVR